MSDPYLIAGLGNPGPEYARSRHNVGWLVAERLAERYDLSFDKIQLKGRVALGNAHGQRVILVRPLTYMNSSGESVVPLMRFYKVPTTNLLVVYDELDIPFNTLRLRPAGGAGGHGGMKSIIRSLGSQDFARLRVGVGRPPAGWDPADFVLAQWTKDEQSQVPALVDRAADAADLWLTDGILTAMNRFNVE
jgi:PTH1 family peptidyl-tRNA hydrolase